MEYLCMYILLLKTLLSDRNKHSKKCFTYSSIFTEFEFVMQIVFCMYNVVKNNKHITIRKLKLT